MPRPKNQRARREELVTATRDLILDRGTTGARLADIADRVGVSSATVLYYYPEIEQLYATAMDEGIHEYCDHREEAVAAGTTATDRLRRCVLSGIPRHSAALRAVRLLFELAPVVLNTDTAAASNRTYTRRQVEIYRNVLEDGAREGEFTLAAPAETVARGLVAMEDGFAFSVLIDDVTVDQEERWLLHHAAVMTGSESLLPQPLR